MTAAARDGEDVVTVVEVAGFPVRVVTLGADLDRSLVGQVRPVLTGAGRDVVIDMSEVGVVDSAGLGLLVRVVVPGGAVPVRDHRAAHHASRRAVPDLSGRGIGTAECYDTDGHLRWCKHSTLG